LKDPKAILFAGIIIGLAIRLFLILKSVDIADVQRMHEVAISFAKGINPYKIQNFYIYPPVWMYFEYLTLRISQVLSIPFEIVVKFWPTISDIVITLLIYKILIKKKADSKSASLWSLGYFLNPISIIISSLHGQFDSIIILLTLISLYLLLFKKKAYLLSTLTLGLAICIKPNPILLIPLYIYAKRVNLKQKVFFLFLCGLPTLLTTAPYLQKSFFDTLKAILGYSGVYDIGYPAFFRGIIYQNNANYWIANDIKILAASRNALLIGIISLYFLLVGSSDLLVSILIIYLFFITTYMGVSAQYLTWIIPFAILGRDKKIITFSFFGLMAIISFYLFFEPKILIGSLFTITGRSTNAMSFYAFSNLTLFLFNVSWLIHLIKKEYKKILSKLSFLRRNIIYITFGVYILLFVKSLIMLFAAT